MISVHNHEIEHDGSISRKDFYEHGKVRDFDAGMFEDFLSRFEGDDVLTIERVAKARAEFV